MSLDIAAVLREHPTYYWDMAAGTSVCACWEKLSDTQLGDEAGKIALAAHQAEKVMEHLRENGREEWGVQHATLVIEYLGPSRQAAVQRASHWLDIEDPHLVRRHVIKTDWEPQP